MLFTSQQESCKLHAVDQSCLHDMSPVKSQYISYQAGKMGSFMQRFGMTACPMLKTEQSSHTSACPSRSLIQVGTLLLASACSQTGVAYACRSSPGGDPQPGQMQYTPMALCGQTPSTQFCSFWHLLPILPSIRVPWASGPL